MKFWKVAIWLAVWCFVTAPAWGAGNFEYSGVPGKWKRASKSAKKEAGEAEAKGKGAEKAAEPEAGEDAGREGKKPRTYTISIPEEMMKQKQ